MTQTKTCTLCLRFKGETGYDPVFGARPLKRFLQRHLETRLARALSASEVEESAKVTFKVKGDELLLEGAAVSVTCPPPAAG